jgi:hypothetical protein
MWRAGVAAVIVAGGLLAAAAVCGIRKQRGALAGTSSSLPSLSLCESMSSVSGEMQDSGVAATLSSAALSFCSANRLDQHFEKQGKQ